MCSMKWPDGAPVSGGMEAVEAALVDVAEKSFFAVVDPCDGARFQELAGAHMQWLSATVRFHERECAGAVRCHIPSALATRLFDAFTGRDPDDAVPSDSDVHDLIGEFANMICGSWLTRAASDRTFTLGSPLVVEASWPTVVPDGAATFAIDDHPCRVDVEFALIPEAAQ
jgi:hypothetical protein